MTSSVHNSSPSADARVSPILTEECVMSEAMCIIKDLLCLGDGKCKAGPMLHDFTRIMFEREINFVGMTCSC